jgi:hypothetical protein
MNLLPLFKEIIPGYAENNMKPTNTKWASLSGKADGTYSYLSALKCYIVDQNPSVKYVEPELELSFSTKEKYRGYILEVCKSK